MNIDYRKKNYKDNVYNFISERKSINLPKRLFRESKYIKCQLNGIKYLPDIKCPGLELDINSNMLTTLPDNMIKTAKKIICFNNEISSLPDVECPGLVLAIYNNKLNTIPANILKTVKYIDCRCNNIIYLPEIDSDKINLTYFISDITNISCRIPKNTLKLLHKFIKVYKLNYTYCDIEKIDDDICAVCHDKQNRNIKMNCCGKYLHKECINKWVSTCSTTCPICRS